MCKAFAFAGGRLGYLAPPTRRSSTRVQLVRLPYHLSALTQAAARAALAHADELLANVDAICGRARPDRATALRGTGFDVADSDANFVLFGRFADRHAVWQALLDRGVLVRDVGLPGWLRVTAGTAGEIDAFRDALPRSVRGDARREPDRRASSGDHQGDRGRSSSSTSTAPASPTSTPACRSSTTCSPSSASTAAST